MNPRVALIVIGAAGAVTLLSSVSELALAERGGPQAAPGRAAAEASGGCNNEGPDVIVGSLAGINAYGSVGGIAGYSIGTTSCNIGDENLLWQAQTSSHPVIAQNLYRLHEGSFEQLGMSWLKHGFTALTGNLCCTCNGQGGSVLGVGCSDPYSAGLNGDQDGFGCGGGNICGGLGPRWEVNASSGEFAYPYADAGLSGDAIYKRLQVANDDLDPGLNPDALYYIEGHYVTPDDAAANNHHNNASYRQALVGSFSGGAWQLFITGPTVQQVPAIFAWQASDPEVVIEEIADQNRGRFYLGYRVTDNGDGTWHYEYALHNLNSDRSGREFRIPVPAGVNVTNAGFHDVDHHSGDGIGGVTYDGTDWPVTVEGGEIVWATETEAENANANALRWSSLYNYRFDANTAPTTVTAHLGLFKSGVPDEVTVQTLGPSAPPCPWDLDGSGDVGTDDFLDLLAQWGTDPGGPPDFDGDGTVGTTDFLELLANWGPCS